MSGAVLAPQTVRSIIMPASTSKSAGSKLPWGDPFTDPLMQIVGVVLILFLLASVFGLGVIYVGDSFATPFWSERSVPPAEVD
jgi:hypothetical protein